MGRQVECTQSMNFVFETGTPARIAHAGGRLDVSEENTKLADVVKNEM